MVLCMRTQTELDTLQMTTSMMLKTGPRMRLILELVLTLLLGWLLMEEVVLQALLGSEQCVMNLTILI